MKKQSILAVLLAATLLLLALVSCTPSLPPESSDNKGQESESSSVSPPEEVPVPELPALPTSPAVSVTGKRVDFDADRKSGAFSFTLSLASEDPSLTDTAMTLSLLGSAVTTDNKRISIEKSYTVDTLSDKITIETDAIENFKTGIYSLRVFKASDNSFLGEALHFTLRSDDEFRAYLLTDTHYTGTNETLLVYNYDTGLYQTPKNGTKSYNGYTNEYDNYGWTSDEKLQRVMDDILMRYKTGEIDMVFILGDAAMNDGNYANYASDHTRYQNGSITYLQNGKPVPPGTVIPENVPYKATPLPHYGKSILEFWDAQLNVSHVLREKFLSQLSAAGVPYYLANGNHDYQYYYNEDKTALDYTPWENMYHYQELFGHKNEKGEYYDATSVDFLIRVIRRDGEFKVLSALSESELASFRERNKNDGNCYDFYVSEDSLTGSDEHITAFMMMNPQQIESYKKYMELCVTYDLVTGVKDNYGQTVRPDYYLKDIIMEMGEAGRDFSNVWLLAHYHLDTVGLNQLTSTYKNIRGFFSGDVHTEQYYEKKSGIPSWIAGYYSHSYDVDTYYVRDSETGEYARDPHGNLIPDNQYYYDRGNPKVANKIWGDTTQHPFNHVILHIDEATAYVEREHQGVFYENDWQEALTYDWVRGWDPDYKHAVDTTKEAGTSFQDGQRTVYVGNDVAVVGAEHAYIGRSYVKNKYNKNELMLKHDFEKTYLICDLAGNELGDEVKIDRFEEGASFTYQGETYYILSMIGGISGHYLYDENGNYVYRASNGKLVYYDFLKDKNGDLVKEYFYMNKNGAFVALGEWDNDGNYKLIDGIYSDIRLYNKAEDHSMQAHGKWNVENGTIEIQNGVIVRGEGFTGFGYAYEFVDGNGRYIPKARVELASENLGYYVPREGYLGFWVVFD